MCSVDVTSHTLLVKISQIRKLSSIKLPEVLIHGIPWTVKVCKTEVDQYQPFLAAYLHCAKRESSNWSHAATAAFELLSFDDDKNSVKQHSIPYVFDSSGIAYGTHDLIKWNELFSKDKKYVKDNSIKMKIEIKIEDPNQPNKSRLKFQRFGNSNRYAANFRLTVVNVANLMAVRSPPFNLNGKLWFSLTVSKDHKSHIGIFLHPNSENISSSVTMTAKLVSSNSDGSQIEKTITSKIKQTETLKLQDIVLWNELSKPENGFINNNSISFQVEIKIVKPQGNVPSAMNRNAVQLLECSICLSNVINQEVSSTPCGHTFCTECIEKVVDDYGVCPLCKERVYLDDLRRIFLPIAN